MTTTLTNWAKNHTYRAGTVHEPRSVEEVQVLVREAGSRGVRGLRALGSRHCFNDVADGAELVALGSLDPEIQVDAETRTVRVGGGVRYGTLAEHLHARGWAVHNLASLPHISVAGAVATATHGSGDARRNLAAAVVGLELVAADGGLRQLGPQDGDLAGAVVSLGALGMVTAVTLEIEPTFDVVQEVRTEVPWDAVLGAFDQVTASADSVSLFTRWEGEVVDQLWRKSRVGRPEGAWAPGPALEAGTVATENLHPLGLDARSTTEQLGRPGPWHERLPHFRMAFTPSNGAELQSEYLVPRGHGPAAIESLRGLSHLIAPLLLVSEVRTIAQDELWLSTAYQQDSVGLHFTWKPLQPEVEALLPRIEQALAPFGARPHWGKLFSATEAGAPGRLAELYPRLGQFRELAARFDPEGLFHNDYLRRHGLVSPV